MVDEMKEQFGEKRKINERKETEQIKTFPTLHIPAERTEDISHL